MRNSYEEVNNDYPYIMCPECSLKSIQLFNYTTNTTTCVSCGIKFISDVDRM